MKIKTMSAKPFPGVILVQCERYRLNVPDSPLSLEIYAIFLAYIGYCWVEFLVRIIFGKW